LGSVERVEGSVDDGKRGGGVDKVFIRDGARAHSAVIIRVILCKVRQKERASACGPGSRRNSFPFMYD
jgi:hypothetical protein